MHNFSHQFINPLRQSAKNSYRQSQVNKTLANRTPTVSTEVGSSRNSAFPLFNHKYAKAKMNNMVYAYTKKDRKKIANSVNKSGGKTIPVAHTIWSPREHRIMGQVSETKRKSLLTP